MDGLIILLKHDVDPVVQTDALQSLQASLGTAQSRDVIERAAYELSDRLWLLEKAMHEKEWDEARRISSGLVAVSMQIGLTEFSSVAMDLAACIQQGDATAIHAVASRLIRVGEQSLFMAVEFTEITG